MKKGLNKITAALLAAGLAFSVQAADITIAYDADPVSMDPHEQLSGATLEMSHLLFDPLVRWTKDFDIEPRLAEKWERIDENTMRFHLRKGVKFHSGNDFSADDVVWTFNR
ncbi:MAG: ABC transporter substrate-binding protein, partial [Oceanisphaera sp.]|uniref:ABC transporter substrate-binding protein n=1 Tax=Oceanisphaera sp. TaxID=1929979 RepID=UPI003C73ADBD